MVKLKTCPNCGKEFKTYCYDHIPEKVYCSPKCKPKLVKPVKVSSKGKGEFVPCQKCGKMIWRFPKREKLEAYYCSRKCYDQYEHANRRKPGPKKIIKCLWCNREYTSDNPSRYCCPEHKAYGIKYNSNKPNGWITKIYTCNACGRIMKSSQKYCTHCVKHRKKIDKKHMTDYISQFKRKCCLCGYDTLTEAIHLHHVNPRDKELALSHLKSMSKDVMIREIAKCVPLCANCHTEVHFNIRHNNPVDLDIHWIGMRNMIIETVGQQLTLF